MSAMLGWLAILGVALVLPLSALVLLGIARGRRASRHVQAAPLSLHGVEHWWHRTPWRDYSRDWQYDWQVEDSTSETLRTPPRRSLRLDALYNAPLRYHETLLYVDELSEETQYIDPYTQLPRAS